MTEQEYKQKRRECFVKFCKDNGIDQEVNISIFDAFDQIFDRAYALGKEKETITQEEIENASLKYMLNRQQVKHDAKREEEASLSDFNNTLKAWDAFDMAQAYENGANFALGKQKKDDDTVTIEKEEYDELCKYRRYAANWAHGLTVCPICGEYNPSGYICANCNNDKNWNK